MKAFQFLFLWLLCLSISKAGWSKTDTLFWFATPHVQQIGAFSNLPYLFHFENEHNDTVRVSLDLPANPTFTPMQLNLLPRSRGSMDMSLFLAAIAGPAANVVSNRGVRIVSSRPIQAYFEVGSATCGCNQEYFALKGKQALGLDFYVAFQNLWSSDSTRGVVPYASIDMVATENGTQIQITSPRALFGIAAGNTVTVNLQAGQTYKIRSLDGRLINKPGGVKISSNKAIAVTINDELIQIGTCSDLTADQIVPVENLKTTYPVLKGNLMVPDLVVVMAVHNNTRVVFPGSALPDILLNAGEFRTLAVTVAAQTIIANKPIYATHYSGIGCSAGMSVLPGLSCNLDTSYAFIRQTNDPLIFNLIIPAGFQDSIRVNGGLPAQVIGGVHFNPVPGTSGAFLWAIFELFNSIVSAGSNVRISLPVGFSIGVRHGNPNQGMRFAYFGDFSPDPYFDISVDSVICAGDTVLLRSIHNGIWPGQWTLPNGSQVLADTVLLPSFNAGMQGWYKFQLLAGSCLPRTDSVFLSLSPNVASIEVFTPTRDSICTGDTLVLRSRRIAGFQTQWYNQNGMIALATADSLIVTQSGSYFATANAYCTAPDTSTTLNVFVEPTLTVRFQLSDSVLCLGDSILFENTTQPGREPLRLLMPNGQVVHLDSADRLWLNEIGSYALWYETSICTFDTTYFTIRAPEVVPRLSNSHAVTCSNDSAKLWWTGRAQFMQWYKDGVLIPAANDSFLVTSENGVYSLRVKADYACSPDTFWTDSVAVYRGQVRAQLWIDQQNGPKPLAVRLNASGSIGHLREWFVNDSLIGTDSLMNVVFDRRGRYALRLHLSDTVAGCTADTVVFITVFDSVTVLFPTVFSPNGDGLNDHYLPVLINANFVDLSIYNRWGELVYFGNGTPSGWDGMFKGQMAPAGGYVAVVRFAADVGEIGLKSSHFQLVR